jgi:acyl-coenzyme A synthetase/AMP-(fatty) acid ligase
VLEAAVVAWPEEKWGGTPMAFVVLKDGVVWESGLEAHLIDPR